ncbi:DUF317 domain-containing protein [Streptomyces celluloflavus]|uniref:DUF317 domain-containing protein n=1 Tax=Streptomyces celluloflavus TaxID=58344 RepID=UPI0034616374|nr:DUF317 domain-containing protein [Streptomyces celluloflavus]
MKQQQRNGPGPTHQQAEQHYLVEPRHLAGGGDLRHVTEYLRASGWKDRSKRRGPIVFDSPDRMVRVGFDPTTPPGGWAIRAKATSHQEAWHAILGPQVPVEIVAGFTDALTKPRSAHAPNVWAPLQGWKAEQRAHFTAKSPDGNAFMQFHRSAPGQAHWWAGARTEHGRIWDATFTPTTPMHLLQSFSSALADPQPVMRPRGHIPPSNRIRTTSVSVLPSELGAWQQARIAAARAAAWARTSWATTQPRKTPAASTHASRTGSVR